jgi:hypothetical protein
MRVSGEAQGLAYAAKHFGLDPYRLWNVGKADLPPHPRPRVYRALLYAMAYFLEDEEMAKVKLICESQGAKVEVSGFLDQLTDAR